MIENILHSLIERFLERVVNPWIRQRTRIYWKGLNPQSVHWRKVDGTVENVIIDDNEERPMIRILYSYKANSEFYSGECPLWEYPHGEDEADRLARLWSHSKIIVRCNPEKPRKSVCLKEDQIQR